MLVSQGHEKSGKGETEKRCNVKREGRKQGEARGVQKGRGGKGKEREKEGSRGDKRSKWKQKGERRERRERK